MTKFIVLADKLISLHALNFLKNEKLLAGVITSYSSPVSTFAKFHKLPNFNIHEIFSPDQQNLQELNQNYDSFTPDKLQGKILLDLGLTSQVTGLTSTRLENAYRHATNYHALTVKNYEKFGNLAFETALVKNASSSTTVELEDAKADYQIRVPKLDLLDHSEVITDISKSVENLVRQKTDDFLAKPKALNLDLISLNSPDINAENLVYQPSKDSAVDIFAKTTAFYGLFPILADRPRMTHFHYPYRHYLDEKLLKAKFHFHSLRLCGSTISEALNLMYENKIYKNSTKKSDFEDVPEDQISPAGFPIGNFVIINDISELGVPVEIMTQPFSKSTNQMMEMNRKIFFHTQDGQWVQVVAFSSNGKKVQNYKAFSSALKMQRVPYKYWKFVDFKFPQQAVDQAYLDVLHNSVENRMNKDASVQSKGLDLHLQKQISGVYSKIQKGHYDRERRNAEATLFDGY